MVESRYPAILLLEEMLQALMLLEQLLPDYAGAPDLITVYSGREALDLLAERLVPLVIMPSELSDGDGLHLAAAIKAASPATRVILCAASPSDDLERYAQAAGVDYYVPEPYELGQLEQAVRDALGINVRAAGT